MSDDERDIDIESDVSRIKQRKFIHNITKIEAEHLLYCFFFLFTIG